MKYPGPVYGVGGPVHDEYTLKVLVPKSLTRAQAIRATLRCKQAMALSMEEAKQLMSHEPISRKSEYPLFSHTDLNAMKELGVEVAEGRAVDPNYGYKPVCPCAMAYVEEVNGFFYMIIEHRSPDGITHTAKNLGPVGGPYYK
jgi:hypothetical protein